jgi:hypothetical protein
VRGKIKEKERKMRDGEEEMGKERIIYRDRK